MTPTSTISTGFLSSHDSDHLGTSASEPQTPSTKRTDRSTLQSIATIFSRLDPRAHVLSEIIQKAVATAGTTFRPGEARLWWGRQGLQGVAVWGNTMPPKNTDGAAKISLAGLKVLEGVHSLEGWAEQSMELKGPGDRRYLVSVIKDSADRKEYFPNSVLLRVVEQRD